PSLMFLVAHPAATTKIYTLSLHDALPICRCKIQQIEQLAQFFLIWRAKLCNALINPLNGGSNGKLALIRFFRQGAGKHRWQQGRSEEHTSELQSRENLVCRLLLEKKKQEA